MFKNSISILLAASIVLYPNFIFANTSTKLLPEGTRVYLKLDQLVSGKRGDAEAGDMVGCSVWRDVDLQGVVLVKAGTKATCKVESVKHANIAGIKGKLVLQALETTAVDGQKLQLTGGYNKDGKSRMALSISLAAIVFVPLIFITGSAAQLPEGTVIDAYTGPNLAIALQNGNTQPQAINLSGMASVFSAEVQLDEFMVPNAKPENFKIEVINPGALPSNLVIDNVNGKPIQAIPLTIASSKSVNGDSIAIATVNIKTLTQHFQKGINRFEVSYLENGQHKSTETILNIQM
jgi:hypothetical protein